MRTNGEGSLSVTELLVEGTSSRPFLSDGTAPALLSSSTGDVVLPMGGCKGCVPGRGSTPATELTGGTTFSSKLFRERSGEKTMRSGVCGEADACMPAAARSTIVLFYDQFCRK